MVPHCLRVGVFGRYRGRPQVHEQARSLRLQKVPSRLEFAAFRLFLCGSGAIVAHYGAQYLLLWIQQLLVHGP